MSEFQLRTPRGPGPNVATVMIDARERRSPACEVAFISHYAEITAVLRTAAAPSLVMFVFDEEGLAARATLPASPDAVRCATVGRHDRVELLLPDDPTLSLRQLAVLVSPTRDKVRYRVLDLRTRLRMLDEFDQLLDGFEADGPMFVSVGRYTVLMIPRSEGPLRWPSDPLEGWRQLPPRSYHRTSHRRARLETLPPPGPGPVNTRVQVLGGVSLPADCTGVVDARPVGFLYLSSATGEARLVIDRLTARSGVLLGRYDRCEAGGSPVLDDELVSRVHALVVQVEGRTTVMDLGSVNGLWWRDRQVSVQELRSGDAIELGRKAVTVRWEAV